MGWFDKHCEICGMKVNKDADPQRFGKFFCSDAHAEEYVAKVREQRKSPPKQEGGGGCC